MERFYIFIVLFSIAQLQGNKCIQMYWKTFDCTPDPAVVSFSKCIIVEPERSVLFAEATISREVPKLNATFTLFIFRESSKTYHKIVHMNVDVCKVFKMPLQNQILFAVYKSMLSQSNVPEKCPLQKATYYFRNINVSTYLPSYLPKNDFKVQLNFVIPPRHAFFNITATGRTFETRRIGK